MFSAINQDYNLLLSEENQNTEVEDNDNDEELMLNILSDQEEVEEVQKRAAAMEEAMAMSGVGKTCPVTNALRLPCVAHTVCV